MCNIPETSEHFICYCTDPASAAYQLRLILGLSPSSDISVPIADILDNPLYCETILKYYKKHCPLLYTAIA